MMSTAWDDMSTRGRAVTTFGTGSLVQFDGGGDQDGKDNNYELIDSPRSLSLSLTRESAS